MQVKKIICLLSFFILTFSSCIKNVDAIVTPTNSTTVDSLPKIKFFNVVDLGKIRVKLNNMFVDSVAQYFPTNYTTAKANNNSIQLFNMQTLDTTLFNSNVPLLAGNNYSCFIYKLGFDWKISIVNDKLTAPDSGYAGIRILDFRTQASTNFVNINLFSLGFFTYGNVNPFIYRHFLDHTSYDYLTQFTPIFAQSNYNIVVYNSNANLAIRSSVEFKSQKLYSIILMNPTSLIGDSSSMKYIFSDVQQHN